MSDQDQNIFDKKEVPQQTQEGESKESGNSNTPNESSKPEPFADLLGSVKNDRGEPKYKNVEDAFKALTHSQQFIPQLEAENKQLKSQLEMLQKQMEKFNNIEENLSRLTSNQASEGTTNQTAIDEKTIAEITERTLAQREAQARQKANLSLVTKTMLEKFGDNAEKEFYRKASEMGMDAQTINGLAASSPQAVLRLFGIDGTQKRDVSSTAPNKGEINTVNFEQKPDSFVGRNKKSFSAGATTQDYMEEAASSKRMVEELHEQGLSVSDLSDPKKYFSTFK